PFLQSRSHPKSKRGWIAEPLDHIIATDIPRTLSIPAATSEQRLHPPRGLITSMFGQLPAVLALSTAYQAIEIQPGLPTCLRPLKYTSKARFQFRQLRPPRQRRHRQTGYRHAILPGERIAAE